MHDNSVTVDASTITDRATDIKQRVQTVEDAFHGQEARIAQLYAEKEQYRNSICALLSALGIESTTVPIDADITFDGTTLTVEQYRFDASGTLLIGPYDQVLRTTVSMGVTEISEALE